MCERRREGGGKEGGSVREKEGGGREHGVCELREGRKGAFGR